MASNSVAQGFMNAASPGVIALFLPNQYYPDHESYLIALGEALKTEYQAIIASGLSLQLDCPDLALSRHMLFTEKSDDEFLDLARLHMEVLNSALEDYLLKNSSSHLLGKLRRASSLRYRYG